MSSPSPKSLYDHTTLLLNPNSDLLSFGKHSRLNISDASTMLKVTFCTGLSQQPPQWERRAFTCLADMADSKPVSQQVTMKQSVYSPAAAGTTGSNPNCLYRDRYWLWGILNRRQTQHLQALPFSKFTSGNEQLSKNQPHETHLNQPILILGTCS